MLMTFLALTDVFGRRSGSWDGHSFIILWTVIGLVFNAVFGLPARRRLTEEFRQVATHRFETRGSNK